jgi:hypothetical protein
MVACCSQLYFSCGGPLTTLNVASPRIVHEIHFAARTNANLLFRWLDGRVLWRSQQGDRYECKWVRSPLHDRLTSHRPDPLPPARTKTRTNGSFELIDSTTTPNLGLVEERAVRCRGGTERQCSGTERERDRHSGHSSGNLCHAQRGIWRDQCRNAPRRDHLYGGGEHDGACGLHTLASQRWFVELLRHPYQLRGECYGQLCRGTYCISRGYRDPR